MLTFFSRQSTAHVLPGLGLLAIPFFYEQPYTCVALMSLSYGLNGAVTVTAITNFHDLSPNYATMLNAIINGLGNSAGFLSPLVVAFFTAEKVSTVNGTRFDGANNLLTMYHIVFNSQNTIDEWRSVFIVGAVVYIVPALLFAVGGSGQVQYWNEPDVKRDGKLVDGKPSTKTSDAILE